MIHVPGDLFSVNPVTARGVPGLFARNERVVCLFEGPRGPLSLVLVGATIVGSMATVWHGVVNPKRPGKIREWRYEDQDIVLKQGEEMGRFLLGSTVVMPFPQGRHRLQSDLGAGQGRAAGRGDGELPLSRLIGELARPGARVRTRAARAPSAARAAP